ncbi:unsaturated chondroitin disaccharide hydrolase [Parabacteroides sp. PF5-5]|uniref:glycoside hydrolase family 88 protein n=1 Tax=unclassified Parabacteroides TaxID=2649774 RepID=UPI0024736AC9|nr:MULTISPECIES: glycoside hydrolase family 88 protein [unclassified Parabacteroides]MDH6305978.1 unsaturated chondroitin disaccharide hydrolase [Parabacteroides sp. PH5-39]MDH6317234.1 unsaturated chondroitin disaccharide hydrolase [Parabacteroides sp. PF5-13]MDH6320690.1 unsaturated chondroitin disaccharide hydrolase [Parabacteroides sp. PH5-13]MDH6324389.1 unsaturated chondroitin disaccharide hydrolase [Parabacteroides sp. PH5-8]MDH6328419.1 unsaturated chondroitin disaccharide hydrolase [P
MKKNTLLFSAICILFAGCNNQEPLSSVIERGLNRSTEQALLMAKELENQEGKFPKTIGKDGNLETSDYGWWCSGFFPGELWYLYEYTQNPELKKYAQLYTDRVEPAKNLTNTHDLGFMLFCSFGNGYRITQNPHYKEVMITGAHSLATRYNPTVCAIRSWDFNKDKWQYPVIIDNMMNLEFFSWIAKETGDKQFSEMADSHAMKTKEHHFRPDFSSYHVVSYDTISGEPHIKQTHQGFADESAWARGQAWALYGYTVMARETGNIKYLELARHIADFIMNHPNLPEDKIPYWDFDDPKIPNVPRDASAAAIMASALIELSQLDTTPLGKEWLALAEQQIRSLSTPEYLAEAGSNRYFSIMHCTGHLPGNSEVDVPLSYADYYYVEALLRLKKLIKE